MNVLKKAYEKLPDPVKKAVKIGAFVIMAGTSGTALNNCAEQKDELYGGPDITILPEDTGDQASAEEETTQEVEEADADAIADVVEETVEDMVEITTDTAGDAADAAEETTTDTAIDATEANKDTGPETTCETAANAQSLEIKIENGVYKGKAILATAEGMKAETGPNFVVLSKDKNLINVEFEKEDANKTFMAAFVIPKGSNTVISKLSNLLSGAQLAGGYTVYKFTFNNEAAFDFSEMKNVLAAVADAILNSNNNNHNNPGKAALGVGKNTLGGMTTETVNPQKYTGSGPEYADGIVDQNTLFLIIAPTTQEVNFCDLVKNEIRKSFSTNDEILARITDISYKSDKIA